MSTLLKPTIVIDMGSGETKAGLAENEYPSCTIPTALSSCDDTYNFGEEALERDRFTYPIQHGIVQNFDYVEKLFEHILVSQLRVSPAEHPVLLNQCPKNPQRDKEKLAELMFEKFDVPAVYEEINSVLTFYSSGRPAGLIVESGHGVTSVVPILSGYAISEAIMRLDVGGGDLDKYLVKLLSEKGYENIRPEEAQKIKENLCFIPEKDREYHDVENYLLPDGRDLVLEKEKYHCTDPLFNPALVEQYDTPGIHEMVFQSIFKCGLDLRRDFANNIILSGGNTLFNGFENRLKLEVEAKVPASMKVDVIADKDRKVFVWRGGSILGSLSTFYKNICITKGEYEEYGMSAVRKRCNRGI
ncbi:actin-3-like [Sitophilus oryzae]|uniref:Actin-3-like n=1 Tax=Sitophilus oryzae TaxID=7048 RepID=A0A6J2XIL0_SITOR|nr:actin-3-like [Sitophilus oryzae]XP_030750944.1 actin-3-like [Sitophilus oryzae]XP_030750945.1 actin-3-like [Sitophilus oryzae]XP_030750946.1 actin-3-like [Sitophilus oryzae]XP_030750947.1 actin-3-like [Sitophilus oryzae]XP_030750948.1 actin-3-like [Sitophilus oryzae]